MSALLTLSYRDLMKFVRDPSRIVATMLFPLIFIAVLGGSLQANLGLELGYNFLTFTFTGVLAQTLFQSTALGIISLIEDRENDFSQEVFVAPISRYAIVFGKIAGESLVALAQGVAIVAFAVVLGVPMSLPQLVAILPTMIVVCLFGGAFGVLVLANLGSQRAANQIFPLIVLPQFFLSGVFNPIQVLPFWLDVLSRIAPMRYAVDLMRNAFYAGQPEYDKVVLASPLFNVTVVAALFGIFLVAGTWLFVRRERNR